MKDLDYIYICTVIGNMSGIPIRLYEDNRLTFYHSFVHLPKDPLTPFENNILAVETHIGYFITPYFHYYGIVNDGKHKIVIGPTIQTANNEQTLKPFLFDLYTTAYYIDGYANGCSLLKKQIASYQRPALYILLVFT